MRTRYEVEVSQQPWRAQMGADIYLNSKYNRAREQWEPKFKLAVVRRDLATKDGDKAKADDFQKEVEEAYEGMFSEGYYRDSYNASALFGVIGLSWWADVVPMLNKNGELPIPEAKKLIVMVQERLVTVKLVKQRLKSETQAFEDPEKVDEWVEYFRDKHRRLVALLEQSIELKEPLSCSP